MIFFYSYSFYVERFIYKWHFRVVFLFLAFLSCSLIFVFVISLTSCCFPFDTFVLHHISWSSAFFRYFEKTLCTVCYLTDVQNLSHNIYVSFFLDAEMDFLIFFFREFDERFIDIEDNWFEYDIDHLQNLKF